MAGDTPNPGGFEAPEGAAGAGEEAAIEYDPEGDAPQSEIEAVLRRHEIELTSIDGVMGVAIGRTAAGEDALVLYLRDATVRSVVPSDIEGHPVETVVTGTIEAYGAEGA